ncbi:prepilin-type N-terminal cleavage/methylation domain-containing protein [Legionella sp. MW5194]|uniref:prepilin-type N-terminal cleavage/methylation domain-containing protein n=1 Tax=Legionella sp. MW5194 TaxID=2662448 RepID=UPI00193E0162|nr:prepilin-type N-terminal cleavage/methylation domain-containing protein [Legionella sp. MW5194]QRN04240.1 prepilin-type N-terminal cleavage/methylation domain-containing protein [Legionella sp. MW5194]
MLKTKPGLLRGRSCGWPKLKKEKGYTLFELMLAAGIVGVLSVIFIPGYFRYVTRVNMTTATADIKTVEMAIEKYYGENNQYPPDLATLGISMRDPWGNPYRYLNILNGGPAAKGMARKDKNLVPINSDYDLYSSGEDGASVSPLTAKASQDDVVRANNGAYIGPAADY